MLSVLLLLWSAVGRAIGRRASHTAITIGAGDAATRLRMRSFDAERSALAR
jgi:hypothetical protein